MSGGYSALSRFARIAVPAAVGVVFLGIWEASVRLGDVPLFVLPPPSAIGASLVANFGSLMGSLWVTLRVTLMACARRRWRHRPCHSLLKAGGSRWRSFPMRSCCR